MMGGGGSYSRGVKGLGKSLKEGIYFTLSHKGGLLEDRL